MRLATSLALVAALCAARPAAGDFVTEVWGNRPLCHHRGTFRVDAHVAQFDLSALPKQTTIHRAVLHAMPRRRDYRAAIELYPLAPDEDVAPPGAKMLALRPPWYNSFDATEAVRACVTGGSFALRVHMKVAPGWAPQNTTLEIAYEGPAGEPTPVVTRLRAVHHDGQTFLTWKEHDDILADCDAATLENMENKLLPLRGRREVVYRIYAGGQPITARTLGRATLIAEAPFVLSMYYLDSVRTIEHPNRERGEGRTPFVGGARARRDPVPPYVIAKGEEPLPRGSGLYVRTITRPAKTYYAVIAAVNGREAVGRKSLSAGNSLQEPVAEQPAPPIPVLQSSRHLKRQERGHPGWTVSTYN